MAKKHMKHHMSIVRELEEDEGHRLRRKLKKQIALLRRLPKDFRDMSPGSPDWEAFADITGRRKEMEAWSSGPVLCLAEPNKEELLVLGKENVRLFVGEWNFTKDWYGLLQAAKQQNYSWLYLPEEELIVITSLNVLLSRFEYNVRARGQIMSERTNKPIGVIH